ncbi:MAG: DUF4238 domain-containing protein [Pseudomarimonas sp.]
MPKVYLKHFATRETVGKPHPKVWVWDVATARTRGGPTRVDAICRRRLLHTPKLTDGTLDWSMEEDLGKSETLAGGIWPELLTSESPLSDPSVRSFLAHFIAMMHLRNIWMFDTMHRGVNLARQLYGSPVLDPAGGMLDVECAENFAKGSFVRMIRDGGVERIASQLLKKRWVILKFPDRVLATGDRPVLFHVEGNLVRGPSERAGVYFPLSADRLLLMDLRTDDPANICCDGPPSIVLLVNTLTTLNAMRVVVGALPLSELPTLALSSLQDRAGKPLVRSK